MTNPYPQPNADQPVLTRESATFLSEELARVDEKREKLRRRRAEIEQQIVNLRTEIDSQDTIAAEFDATADRYRQRLAGAPVSLLSEAPVWPQNRQQQPCQTCGDPMVWSDPLGEFIHPLPNNKYAHAGESCQQSHGDTKVLDGVEAVAS